MLDDDPLLHHILEGISLSTWTLGLSYKLLKVRSINVLE